VGTGNGLPRGGGGLDGTRGEDGEGKAVLRPTEKETRAMKSTGCPSVKHVRRALWEARDVLPDAVKALAQERDAFGGWAAALRAALDDTTDGDKGVGRTSVSAAVSAAAFAPEARVADRGARSGKGRKVRVKKISRNKKCPCGSGRKYKNCCKVKAASAGAEDASGDGAEQAESALIL
jgi:hypothetical protein